MIAHGGHARMTSTISGPNSNRIPRTAAKGANIDGMDGAARAVVVAASVVASGFGGFVSGSVGESTVTGTVAPAVGIFRAASGMSAAPPSATLLTDTKLWA